MEYIDNLSYKESSQQLINALSERILVLDGAMGTMIQRAALSETDFKGERFKDWEVPLKGCNDLLVLTAPEVIENIHYDYLNHGARIIETDTFNANSISLNDYHLAPLVEEINMEGATLARRVADRFMQENPGEQCWVAGSVGPTGKSLSMSQGLEASGSDAVGWDELAATYELQMYSLIKGGVDLLIIETIFDSLNAKAAIWSARRAMEKLHVRVPLILSVTLTESGRTLAGQTLEAFVATVEHASPLAVGLNCGFGAEGMKKYVEALQPYPFGVCVYPNAGLPDEMGCYSETPAMTARQLSGMMAKGWLNIVGGCCGTTPEHIAAVAEEAGKYKPRDIPEDGQKMVLAGLETLTVTPERNFVNVGERCNVAGSRKFLRLIKEGSIDEAVNIARNQVDAGAQIIDINMDDAMLDAVKEMTSFISRIGIEPDVMKVPLMIDSSNWNVIVESLKHVQGRPIINSISLKEGEERFLAHARHIKEMGAAVIVMAFDEEGQADTFERRIQVCGRAYKLLTEKVGFRGCDIVFDPNVLAVATGIEAHNNYGSDFIRAVEWIKANLPGAKVSGGISNLSFSFRGNNPVREAMHSVFLYHAIKKGMDMGIVNAAAMQSVEDVDAELRAAIEDVIFNQTSDATENLVEIAARIKESSQTSVVTDEKPEEVLTPSKKVEQMLIKGLTEGIDAVLKEAMAECGGALAVIDGPMMTGMNKIGELFGEGKLFLPQVVKSARTMKIAVEWLTPYIEEEKKHRKSAAGKGKMVIATVKGDVHDIGKNIVSVVMNCNGFDMIDMGVMVPGEDIVERAEKEDADFIGLSGLITPSLEEMCHVARLMEIKGMKIPLLIGGATTSAVHTAVKIAPCYGGPVVYTHDAASLPAIAQKLISKTMRDSVVSEIKSRQEAIRREYEVKHSMISFDEAKRKAPRWDFPVFVPKCPGRHEMEFTVSQLLPFINWRAFLSAWGLDASFAAYAQLHGCDHCKAQWMAAVPQEKMEKALEAVRLIDDAKDALAYLDRELVFDGIHGVVVLLPAGKKGDDIFIYGDEVVKIPCLRQQSVSEDCAFTLSLADFVAPLSRDEEPSDYIAVFSLTQGTRFKAIIDKFKRKGDEYRVILYQSLADRLVEAATEMAHKEVRTRLWGYTCEDDSERHLLRQDYQGIRPAVGYPSLPDQSIIFELDKLVDYTSLGVSLTESGAMYPASSTTGLMIAHPDSRYFVVGHIDDAQRADYIRRRGKSEEELKAFLR